MKLHPFQLELIDLSLVLFVLSLILPAIYISHDYIDYGSQMRGYDVLLSGWGAILDGCPAWLANIFFIAAYFAERNNKKWAFCYSISAVGLALSSYMYTGIWNDGDGRIKITGYGIGFYLWVLSFIWMVSLSLRVINNKPACA